VDKKIRPSAFAGGIECKILMKKLLLILTICLVGCANLSTFKIVQNMQLKAQKCGFKKTDIDTGLFTIRTFSKINDPKGSVHFYIEGDGRAWINKRRVSQDPTPRNDLVFQLASIDTAENIVYIARPCQYTGEEKNPAWNKTYWTDKRFSQEVIDSSNAVIDEYVKKYNFSTITLIGFSGGGAVAVLCAAERDDVDGIVTIAGNLDHEKVNEYNKVSQLQYSLNPIDVAKDVKSVRQIHFVGEKDQLIPSFIAYNFKNASGFSESIDIVEVDNVSHHSGWVKFWKSDKGLKKNVASKR
jgi:predicted esterase